MKTRTQNFSILIMVILISLTVALIAVFSSSNVKAQYSGNENHEITLAQAVQMVHDFRNNPTAPTNKGGYFSRDIFDKILAQNGCSGIRYYYAKSDDSSATLVLVGVTSEGKDMEQGVIGEIAKPCPPICDSEGQLN